jgi:hypothetical protein
LKSSAVLEAVRAVLRKRVPHLADDRHFHPDMEIANAMVRSGALIAATSDLPGVTHERRGSRLAAGDGGRRPADRQHAPHRNRDPVRDRGPARLALAGPQGRRLVGGKLYDFATDLGATVVRTAISRSVIDVNRDPSGASLYPGQATTELCPTTTFDGEPLYRPARRRTPPRSPADAPPSSIRITRPSPARSTGCVAAWARWCCTTPTRSARMRRACSTARCRSSTSARTSGQTCDPALTAAVEAACDASGLSRVTNGRFKGGWTTRRYGQPTQGVHAIQMELACRGYMDEPDRSADARDLARALSSRPGRADARGADPSC